MDIADTFFKQFEILADAPNAVPRLRELILQLAVHGKLVSPDPNDEPASILLEKIQNQKKAQLDIRLSHVEEKEFLFDVKQGWVWTRFNDICSYIQRGKSPKYVDFSPFPVIAQKCIHWNGFYIDRAKFICPDSIKTYSEERFLRTGDILWNSTGTGTLGRATVYKHEENNFDAVVADSHVTVIRPLLVSSIYLLFWIASRYVQDEIENKSSGSTKQIELSTSTIKNHVVPLPPLNEQKRIVEKVDKLMEWCDRLEKQQQQRRETCINLNRVALTQLTTAKTTDEFSDRWQKIRDNFDLLYSLPENVSQLRQTILQLAVMGKLVKQDPNDKSALSILKKQNPKIDNYFFPIPQNWILAKLENLGDFLGGGTPSKSNPEFWNGDIPWISPRDMKKDYLSSGLHFITTEALKESTAQMIPKSSLLMVVRGMILAHSFPVAISMQPLSINQDMKALKLFNTEAAEYLLIACKALKCYFLAKVARSSHGTCKLDSKDLTQFFVPIPPLNEQKRIVAKVEEMMRLCDGLEAKLKEAETNRQKLLESGIRQVLSQI